ncbi:hypothetical protein M1M25_gp008 [Tenacibaculum phage Gundel_1]|uniref:Uncharacterized protein n=1 Tax=Tenacibaculum phage Gundel_1 TaxID=2745672 RepID=A0A8E4ZL47_9CAUD|nr:hypothetical protein M1M25_gp008 [Tenacibaculum phage Gundel_1]QQV91516.1 hypothetical protein Gundel1_8 [Tenacibaculum phage Gundel_1]
MKTGTKFYIELIVDSSTVKNTDIKTALSIKISSLKTALNGEGIEIYEYIKERVLFFGKDEQIRQKIKLILSKPLTKNSIYKVINSVEAQPLNFKELN